MIRQFSRVKLGMSDAVGDENAGEAKNCRDYFNFFGVADIDFRRK